MVTALAIPEVRPYAVEADRPQFAPETLLVAGIRDRHSLGWSVAQNWLEEVPNAEVIATYRSHQADDFLARQSIINNNSIISLEADWQKEDASEQLAENLGILNTYWQNNFGYRLNITGVAHCVARAHKSNFTNSATEIDEEVYLDAFRVSTLSLIGLVNASLPYLAPNSGIVTFGYGDPEKTEVGYGGAMQLAKAGLTKAVMALAEDLGRPRPGTLEPKARIAEIVTGYIPTRSGKGVSILQGIKPKDAEARSSDSAILASSNGSEQLQAAGSLAVLFMRHPAFMQTTGQRLFVDGGASVRSQMRIS